MRGGALELVPRCMVSLFVAFILLQRIPVCTEWAGARPRTVVQTGRVNGGHCPCLSNGRGQGDRAIALPTSDFQDLLSWRDPPELDELCALYAVSDVCLISSTRDGMNLVSYEYVACQQARQGVMILSEFAGAAQSLNGSIVVNPWDSQQVANAIHEAVTMDAETRAENHQKLFKVCLLACLLLIFDKH